MARKKNTAQPLNEKSAPSPLEVDEHGALFDSEAAEKAMVEDPLFIFLKNHWQNLLWAVAIVFIVIYGKNAFEQSKRANLERASDVYVRLKQEYEQFTSIEDSTSEVYAESKKRLTGYVSALKDEPSPYDQIAKLYESLVASKSGDLQKVEAIVKEIHPSDFKSLDAGQRLFQELTLLSLSRALLDSTSTADMGREKLYELATAGDYARVAAAISYARVVNGEAETTKAAALLEEIIKEQPEQSDLVENELALLKKS